MYYIALMMFLVFIIFVNKDMSNFIARPVRVEFVEKIVNEV